MSKQVKDPEPSHWEDVPGSSVEDWQYEVANGYTRESYREWAMSRAESERTGNARVRSD